MQNPLEKSPEYQKGFGKRPKIPRTPPNVELYRKIRNQ